MILGLDIGIATLSAVLFGPRSGRAVWSTTLLFALTDPQGALAVPEMDDDRSQIGGLLTWADFSRGVYGGQVDWARWLAPTFPPATGIPHRQ